MMKQTTNTAITTRPNTIKRNEAIRARYKVLYEVERRRLDDCIALLSAEYYLTERIIWRVLKG